LKAVAANRDGRGVQRSWISRCRVCALLVIAGNAQATGVAGDASADSCIVATRSEYAATLTAGEAIAVDNPYGDVSARFESNEEEQVDNDSD